MCEILHKQIRRITIIAIITLFVICSGNSTVLADCVLIDKASKKQFHIFDALLYEHHPDLSNYCIEPITILYAREFFSKKPDKNNYELPDDRIIRKAAEKAKSKGRLTVIDIEHWPTKHGLLNENSIQSYLGLIRNFKKYSPKIKVGYYGIVPIIDFPRARQSTSDASYQGWVNDNTRVKVIANVADVFFPSLYTINSNRRAWSKYALAQIREGRRLAEGKPIYPFIWPNYHPQGGRYPLGKEVERAYWRMQLDLIKATADGVVLWGGNRQEWSEHMMWWRETKQFIIENFISRSIKQQ